MADGRDLRVAEDHARGERAVGAVLAAVSRPSTWSAATRAWYLPMCVNSARPLTSPIAYSQSWPGDQAVLVGVDVLAGLEAEVLEAELLGLRRAAERDEQHVAA